MTGKEADYRPGIGKDWIDAHEWLCDPAKLKELLDKHGDPVAVVGCASNQDDYLGLFDKIFLLHCKEETFLHRLRTREGDDEFARDKSEQEQVLSWYKDFENKMLTRGAVPVNTEDPIDVVVDKIAAEIRA